MSRYDPKREGLEYLLDLHRETYEVGGGWWVSIRAVRVESSEERPHGLLDDFWQDVEAILKEEGVS